MTSGSSRSEALSAAWKVRVCGADFALADHRALPRVNELDGILDGDHVVRRRRVDGSTSAASVLLFP